MAATLPHRKTDWTPLFFGSVILLAITFVAYTPALRAGFIWDDDDMLFENPLVTGAGGLQAIWFSTKFYDYFPLTLSSFWIEWRLWGNHAASYHFTNVLLHAFSAIFFWRSLKYLKIPGAWLIALLFVVHPVNVESVAWITERKNTLSLFFYALSLLLYFKSEGDEILPLRHPMEERRGVLFGIPLSLILAPFVPHGARKKGPESPQRFPTIAAQPKFYFLSLAIFLLALLSKTSVVMLPVVLLGCAGWKHGKIRREDFVRTIPFFALSLILGLVTIWFQYNRAISTDVVQENNFWARIAGAGWAIWFYLYKLFVPLKLSFVYPRWKIDPQSLVSFLPTMAVVVCFALFWFYRRSWGRPFLFAFGYFVVTLFPVLGFFNIYFQKYSFVADHWQYQSMITPLALFIAGLAFLLEKITKSSSARVKSDAAISPSQLQTTFTGILVAICLCVLTFNQTKIYANPETLWRDTVQKNPDAWIAHNLLGAELAQQEGKLDVAMEHYSTAIRLNPNHAEAHNNLGRAYAIRGNFTDALEHFRVAHKLNPNLLVAANSLTWILATHPNPKFRNGAEAVLVAQRAVDLTKQKDVTALENLAAAYAETGNFAEAIKTAKKGIELANAAGEKQTAEQLTLQMESYQFYRPLRDPNMGN